MHISLRHVLILIDYSNNCHANVLKTINHNKNTNMSQFHYAYFCDAYNMIGMHSIETVK